MPKIGVPISGNLKSSRALLISVACFFLPTTALATPSITLSKKVGPPTSKILVSGSGFAPHVGVDIFFDTKDEALVVTDGKGEFHDAKIHAPSSAFPGKHWVTALERNNDKGDQELFVVFTDWPQLGFDQRRRGSNTYENILGPSNVSSLSLRWSYSYNQLVWADGAAPIISNGQLFIGSYSTSPPYYFYALDSTSGTRLWQTSNVWPFFFTPTVANSTVYVDSGGPLYALQVPGGSVRWSYNGCTGGACGGAAVSPAVVNGVVYATMGDNALGAIFALDAATGALLWKWDAGSWFLSPPTVVDGVVYAGSADDNVYAVDAKTGTLVWKYATNNWVTAAPVVANGVVYVGSFDSCVYALEQKTGRLLWKYCFGGFGIVYAPALANGVLFVAGPDDNVYALNANTGALIWKYTTGGETIALSVANGVVYGGSLWDSLYALDANTGNLLWLYSSGGIEDELISPPTIANGVLYTATMSGNLRAFSVDVGETQRSHLADHPDLSTLHPDLKLQPSNNAGKR